MLALIYIFLTAQTISVRRLCLFFVVVLTSVTGVFGVLRERAALTDALVTAITLTLFRVESSFAAHRARQHPRASRVS